MTAKYELAWAAGFFDGDGSSGLHRDLGRARRTGKMLHQFQMQLSQSGGTEELERFHAAVGGRGTIGGPYFRKPDQYTRKPQYRWIAYAKMAREAYALIEPYLCSVKRAQAEQALKALEEERK